MTNEEMKDKLELTELSNKLFMYCDAQQWRRLQDEVFAEKIFFDMSSAGGGEPATLDPEIICKMWENGFAGLDAIHHQAGHYLIDVNGDEAGVFGYAVAWHHKKGTVNGTTHNFVGSYDLKAKRSPGGWRFTQFRYNLKFIEGNAELK